MHYLIRLRIFLLCCLLMIGMNVLLIMGGYVNSIPLDETIDAVYAVGQMLPSELRVTSLGGLAVTPSALAMPRLR